jgi:hypothetical protein
MTAESAGFFARLVLFFVLPLKVLFNGRFAAQVDALSNSGAGSDDLKALESEVSSLKERAEKAEAQSAEDREALSAAAAAAEAQDATGPALQLLGMLQRDGRLIDFLTEDVAGFSDSDVGAAARLVHDGCKKTLSQYFTLEPIRSEEEGAKIKVEKGFDAAELRLTGNVAGDPPYSGELAHSGWRVTQVRLPELAEGNDPHIVAPAEVELP